MSWWGWVLVNCWSSHNVVITSDISFKSTTVSKIFRGEKMENFVRTEKSNYCRAADSKSLLAVEQHSRSYSIVGHKSLNRFFQHRLENGTASSLQTWCKKINRIYTRKSPRWKMSNATEFPIYQSLLMLPDFWRNKKQNRIPEIQEKYALLWFHRVSTH